MDLEIIYMKLHLEKRYPHRNKLKALWIIFTGLLGQAVTLSSTGGIVGNWGALVARNPSYPLCVEMGFPGYQVIV